MSREIIKNQKSNFAKPQPVNDPRQAWEDAAKSGQYRTLLAHAEDGVIWGKVENGKLALSSDAFPDVSPLLRPETLRELRLFGENAEWYLWRTDTGWRSRAVVDGTGQPAEWFDESCILWGTDSVGQAQLPFTLVTEVDTGIRHAPPLPLNARHSLRLVMRHYLAQDEQGAVYIQLSRLVKLQNGGQA